MHFSKLAALVPAMVMSLAAAAPVTTSAGSAAVVAAPEPVQKRGAGNVGIHNNCPFDITVEPVNEFASEGVQTIAARSTWWHAQEDYGGYGRGVSLKMAGGEGGWGIAQFEYTVADAINQVHYDLSHVDGNPFVNYAQYLEASDPNSEKVWCAPGQSPCGAAYTNPTDNWADHGAPLGSDLNFYVC